MYKQKISLSKEGRVDQVIRSEPFRGSHFFSRKTWKKVFENGWVNSEQGKIIRGLEKLKKETKLVLNLPSEELGLIPQYLECMKVISVNKDWLAMAKPEQIPSYAKYPWEKNTFANYVAGYLEKNHILTAEEFASLGPYPKLEGGLVHRLDNDTSGIMLIALNDKWKKKAREAFTLHKVQKSYLAIVLGAWNQAKITKELYFQQKNKSKIQIVDNSEKEILGGATYTVEKIMNTENYSLLCITTKAGIRHQVRVVMAHLGYPLLGDFLYQNEEQKRKNPEFISFHQLHASEISMDCGGNEFISAKAPIPAPFQCNLEKLGLYYDER